MLGYYGAQGIGMISAITGFEVLNMIFKTIATTEHLKIINYNLSGTPIDKSLPSVVMNKKLTIVHIFGKWSSRNPVSFPRQCKK